MTLANWSPWIKVSALCLEMYISVTAFPLVKHASKEREEKTPVPQTNNTNKNS